MSLGADAAFDAAEAKMIQAFKGNDWFNQSYWPENRLRVKRMMADLLAFASRLPNAPRVFEPGCANGFVSILARHLGCEVYAADAWNLPERTEEFNRLGIQYLDTNFNLPNPFQTLSPGSFDAILFGEVFEHLLNCPQDFIKDLFHLLKPGGILILTTPSPSTLANAVRTLLDRNSVWGTHEFMTNPKLDLENRTVIDVGEIHYREYTQREVVGCLQRCGFQISRVTFIQTGSTPQIGGLRRFFKKILSVALPDSRLFGNSHYVIAHKPL